MNIVTAVISLWFDVRGNAQIEATYMGGTAVAFAHLRILHLHQGHQHAGDCQAYCTYLARAAPDKDALVRSAALVTHGCRRSASVTGCSQTCHLSLCLQFVTAAVKDLLLWASPQVSQFAASWQVDADLRSLPQTQAELALRSREARNALWDLCDRRMEANEARAGAIRQVK